MGELADVKLKRLLSFLDWLARNCSQVTVSKGGKHNVVVKYPFWDRPFPLPTRHRIVDKYIIQDFRDRLIESGICTEQEFSARIR